MAFTYAADMAVQRDRVRLLYGDVDPAAPLLQDGELALVLIGGAMAQTSDLSAAMAATRIVLSRYAHTAVDISAGGTSVALSQRIAHLRDTVLPSLEALIASGAGAVPYAGGISWADVLTREDDTDRVAPAFGREPASFRGPVVDPSRWGR